MIDLKNKIACLIWGGYARGNTGDELCLAAALERKQAEGIGQVAVLSHQPEYTARFFPDATIIPYVPPVRRKNRFWSKTLRLLRRDRLIIPRTGFRDAMHFDPDAEWVRALSDAKQLYLAGGGYLTDLFPLQAILPPIQLANWLKVPVVTAPIGIGPIKDDHWAEIVVAALRGGQLLVRDETSMEFCQRNKLMAKLAPDDAFAFVKKICPSVLKPAHQTRRKIGVCIFPQYGRQENCDLSEWWISFLRGLQAEHPGHDIEGFCFHTSLEAEFAEMKKLFTQAGLNSAHVLSPATSLLQAMETVCSYAFIVSTRFHAVVAANALRIPNVAVASGDYYQAKMKSAVSGHEEISRCVNPHLLSPEDLLAICKSKLADVSSRD